MTPKEKAKEFCNKFLKTYKTYLDLPFGTAREEAKENALMAVNEILNHHSQEQGLYRIDTYYWQQVKQEIDKL